MVGLKVLGLKEPVALVVDVDTLIALQSGLRLYDVRLEKLQTRSYSVGTIAGLKLIALPD